MTTGFRSVHELRPISVGYGRGSAVKEAEKAQVVTGYTHEERLPHPNNMNRYEEWGNDAEASVALNVLTEIIAGVSYYTEMEEEFKPKSADDPFHDNKVKVDEYGESVNLDEKLQYITHTMLHKGFCPVEILEEYDVKILPPETFFIHRDKKGTVLKYTQERSRGDVLAKWEGKQMKEVQLFFFGWSTSHPYGKSLLEPIGTLIDERAQMNMDMPKAIHRWAYPIPIMETSGPKEALQTMCEDRDIDDWMFIGNAREGEVRFNTLSIDPQARFIPYIELVYYQICEGLHAPLLLYLKNATEASATVMMESVDRLVNGVQRYIKRRVEKHLFKPQVGDPVPRMVWGQPKTGLEEITMEDLGTIMPYMPRNQQQHLLKQYINGLPEPEWDKDPQPMLPMAGGQQQPFQKKPKGQELPVEVMLERLNDVDTQLQIIEANYGAKKLSIIEACKLADRTITVYMKRTYPNDWKRHRDERFQTFIYGRLKPMSAGKKVYRVEVPP